VRELLSIKKESVKKMPGRHILEISAIQSTAISLSYHTLTDNNPYAYDNYIAVWEYETCIPTDTKPLLEQALVSTDNNGAITIEGLDPYNKPYLIAYSVGAGSNDFCATAYLPGGDDLKNVVYVDTRIELEDKIVINPHRISIICTIPFGIDASKANHWINLSECNCNPYNVPVEPLACVRVTASHSSNFQVLLDGLNIIRDATYTVAYFVDFDTTSIASTLFFSTVNISAEN
jgi:hypothetical protein